MIGYREEVLRPLVELACRAPSVHNTQPWAWRTTADGLDLHADPGRALAASDPQGRNLVISCGAALHHAEVVAGAMGWAATVTRFPDGHDSTRLAHLALTPAQVADDAADVLLSVRERCTDRRRFTSWPVPHDLLHAFARAGGARGAQLVPIVDATDRFRLDRLVERARSQQARDKRVADEQRAWVDHSTEDGVPSEVLPSPNRSTSVTTPNRFNTGLLDDPAPELESSDGVVLICGYTDTPEDWLRSGEALSTLWLRATLDGLSVVPLSQVIEVEETRMALQHEVLGGLAVPHILVRLGWQELSRSELARTARRPLDEVLDAT
jgi:nitroreductase